MKNEKIKKYLHKKIKGFQPISQYNEVVSIKTMIASITAMVEKTGKVNFDFSDVKSILDNAIEISFFSGTEKDIATISCPEVDGVLLSIEGPKTLSLDKCRNIVNKFSKKISEKARIVWGAKINNKLKKIKCLAILAQINNRDIIYDKKDKLKYIKKEIINIDRPIKKFILKLNEIDGIMTYSCCAGHSMIDKEQKNLNISPTFESSDYWIINHQTGAIYDNPFIKIRYVPKSERLVCEKIIPFFIVRGFEFSFPLRNNREIVFFSRCITKINWRKLTKELSLEKEKWRLK